ncbi:hypothetical protein [Nocardia abscessus]|uniref:hypothetical protein n=1 Tax=Nocardia abscessus TaxID=120957 RepID=UPI0024579588|nr:hypothetical protein [Nocardia abscessus]
MAMEVILKPRAHCCVRIGLSINDHRHVIRRDAAERPRALSNPPLKELVRKLAGSAGGYRSMFQRWLLRDSFT